MGRAQHDDRLIYLACNDANGFNQICVIGYNGSGFKISGPRVMYKMGGKIYIRTLFLHPMHSDANRIRYWHGTRIHLARFQRV